MPTYNTTDKFNLRCLDGSNPGSDVDEGFDALAADVETALLDRIGSYTLIASAAAPGVAATFSGGTTYLFASDGTFVAAAASTTKAIPVFFYAAQDHITPDGFGFDVTRKGRLRGNLLNNTVGTTGTFTFGVHPLSSVAGSGGNITYTVGAAVSGSTVVLTNPASGSTYHAVSTDFDWPSDGRYVLAMTPSAALSANALASFSAQLHHRIIGS